jgi:hypothetical protein
MGDVPLEGEYNPGGMLITMGQLEPGRDILPQQPGGALPTAQGHGVAGANADATGDAPRLIHDRQQSVGAAVVAGLHSQGAVRTVLGA